MSPVSPSRQIANSESKSPSHLQKDQTKQLDLKDEIRAFQKQIKDFFAIHQGKKNNLSQIVTDLVKKYKGWKMEADSLKSAYQTLINEKQEKKEELEFLNDKIESENMQSVKEEISIVGINSIWLGHESTEALQQQVLTSTDQLQALDTFLLSCISNQLLGRGSMILKRISQHFRLPRELDAKNQEIQKWVENRDNKLCKYQGKRELFVDAVLNDNIMKKFWQRVRKPKGNYNEQQLLQQNSQILRELALEEIASQLQTEITFAYDFIRLVRDSTLSLFTWIQMKHPDFQSQRHQIQPIQSQFVIKAGNVKAKKLKEFQFTNVDDKESWDEEFNNTFNDEREFGNQQKDSVINYNENINGRQSIDQEEIRHFINQKSNEIYRQKKILRTFIRMPEDKEENLKTKNKSEKKETNEEQDLESQRIIIKDQFLQSVLEQQRKKEEAENADYYTQINQKSKKQTNYDHIVNKLHPAITEKSAVIGEYNRKVKLFDKIDLIKRFSQSELENTDFSAEMQIQKQQQFAKLLVADKAMQQQNYLKETVLCQSRKQTSLDTMTKIKREQCKLEQFRILNKYDKNFSQTHSTFFTRDSVNQTNNRSRFHNNQYLAKSQSSGTITQQSITQAKYRRDNNEKLPIANNKDMKNIILKKVVDSITDQKYFGKLYNEKASAKTKIKQSFGLQRSQSSKQFEKIKKYITPIQHSNQKYQVSEMYQAGIDSNVARSILFNYHNKRKF